LYVFFEILKRSYPTHDPEEYFYNRSNAPHANSLVMERNIFMNYSDELFKILSDSIKLMEVIWERANLPELPTWHGRYPGFLGEIFLGYWLHVKGIEYAPVKLVTI
jgi:hypothetical protein